MALMYPPYRYEAKELHDAMQVTKQVGWGRGRNAYKDWGAGSLLGTPSPREPGTGTSELPSSHPLEWPSPVSLQPAAQTGWRLPSRGHEGARLSASQDSARPGVQDDRMTSAVSARSLGSPMTPTAPLALAESEEGVRVQRV